MIKRWRAAIGAICLFAILFGCQAHEETAADRIEQDIAFLCSDECHGRLPGSEGNKLAQEHIQAVFEEAGLVPLEGYSSLLVPYTQEVFSMDQEQTLTAVFPDGSSKTFRAGADFYPCICGGFSGEVTSDPADPELENKVYLWKEGQPSTSTAAAVVRETERGYATEESASNQPLLVCRSEIFGQLEGCVSLSLEGAELREETLHNVVGVLPCGDGKAADALLLTAHFDHVGGYGDVIYRGALDNASGTALLLEAVRQLAAAENTTGHDIVFVAFNGEDMGLRGSEALAGALPYEVVNVINVDCVGYKDAPTVGVTGENAQLQSAVIAAFQDEISFGPVEGAISDQLSFDKLGFPAVVIIDDLGEISSFNPTHDPGDTPDILNMETIAAVVGPLCRYAQTADLIPPDPPEPEIREYDPAAENTAEHAAFLAEARAAIDAAGLSYDQVLPMENKTAGWTYFVWDTGFLANADAAEAVISPAKFPESLGEFQLDRTRSLNPDPAGDLGQDNINMRLIDPEQEKNYELGVPREKTDADKTIVWQLKYTGEELSLSLMGYKRGRMDLEEHISLNDEVQTLPADGDTVYQCFVTWEDKKISREIIYAAEDLPYYYILYNSNDNMKALDSEAHLQLMLDAIPQLREIPELP